MHELVAGDDAHQHGTRERSEGHVARPLERAVRTEEVRPRLAAHFGELFERNMLQVSRADLEEKLSQHLQHALAPRPSEVLEFKGSLA